MLRKVGDLMKREVYQLPPSASVYQAACLMKKRGCESVVVTQRGRILGIFTTGDLVKRVAAERRSPSTVKLVSVMTEKPDMVSPETLAIDALRMMQDGRYRHLPVVDGKQLVGIISRRDFFGREQSIVEDEDHISEVIW